MKKFSILKCLAYKKVDFAVQLGLVDKEDGKDLMLRLEKELSKLHEAFTDVK